MYKEKMREKLGFQAMTWNKFAVWNLSANGKITNFLYYINGNKNNSVVSSSLQPHVLAHQPPPSMGFCRQEYWSGLPFSPPGESSQTRIKPDSSPLAPTGKPLHKWSHSIFFLPFEYNWRSNKVWVIFFKSGRKLWRASYMNERKI